MQRQNNSVLHCLKTALCMMFYAGMMNSLWKSKSTVDGLQCTEDTNARYDYN